MSHAALRIALAEAFQNGFKTGAPAAAPFPVRYPNRPFKEPRGAVWGSFSIQLASTEFSALGKNEERTMGVLYLQVFCPEESGTKAAYEARDIVAAALMGQTISAGSNGAVEFWETSLREVGLDPAGLYQVNVMTDFRFETIGQNVIPGQFVDSESGAVLVDSETGLPLS